MKLKIAVLFGGTSFERDVSLATAASVVKQLKKTEHTITPFDTEKGPLDSKQTKALLETTVNSIPPLKSYKDIKGNKTKIFKYLDQLKAFDIVFIALHGSLGEDGHIQALLELYNIPYTGSNLVSSAIGMNKHLSKRLIKSSGILTPNWLYVTKDNKLDVEIKNYPVIVKPNAQGSTIGLSFVNNPNDLEKALDQAFSYDYEVLIEDFIAGRELTCSILDNQALTVGEIFSQDNSFNYKEKYQPGMVKEVFPAELDSDLLTYIQTNALTAHHILHLSDYSRSDFRLDKDNKLWFLEINTLPGLTKTSLFPQAVIASGLNLSDIYEQICFQALGRFRKKQL